MKIDICSPDAGFLRACMAVMETWISFVCIDAELAAYDSWSKLPQQPRAEQGLLLLDADHLEMPLNYQSLEAVCAGYLALFVCSRDSKKAISLYRLRPNAFLNKPLSASALDRAMSRCVSLWQRDLKNLELTENRSRMAVPMCDVLWAEAQGRNCMLHCLCRDVLAGESMSDLTDQLPEDVFVRCQRSYLVNMHHVKATDGKFVYMSNGAAISIGRNNRLEVISAVQRYQSRWNMQLE